MVYVSLVASHSDQDLERIARISSAAAAVLKTSSASPIAEGAVVLSTCNRFEVYAHVADARNAEAFRADTVEAIAAQADLPEELVSATLQTLIGDDVVKHLFSVGAGLDSAVVGEREIAGQVRRSLVQAQEAGTADGAMTQLFQRATRTAKEVGSQTALGSQGKSMVSVGLDLAEELLPEGASFPDLKAVIIGTGAYAGATLSLLQARGVHALSVYSASGRAEEFVASRYGTALTDESLAQALGEADLIIGCSGGDERITADDLASVRPDGAPLIIMDLALTHDFDPDVRQLPGVDLMTLETIRMAAPTEAAGALSAAREIVEASTAEFLKERSMRQVDSAIVALRRHTLSVLESEMEKVRSQHGCSAAAEEVEFAMRRMVRQLLHLPTVRARELAAEGRTEDYIAGLEALYGIDTAPSASAGLAAKACPVSSDGTGAAASKSA